MINYVRAKKYAKKEINKAVRAATPNANSSVQATKNEAGVEQGTLKEVLDRRYEELKPGTSLAERATRRTYPLPYGTSVIDTDTPSPVDVTIEGDTLISLGQTPLEVGKCYVHTDKKVRVNGKVGPGKFIPLVNGKAIVSTIADFEGKVSGSVVENPHRAFAVVSNSTLTTNFGSENFGGSYLTIYKVNDNFVTNVNLNNEGVVQHRFSFNIIEQIERTIGRIPGGSTTQKSAWLRNNLTRILGKWRGNADSSVGRQATFSVWNSHTSSWEAMQIHNKATPENLNADLIRGATEIARYITNDGYVHFLANAEASDGVVASTIRTDYISCEVEVDPAATLFDPCVQLYEVTIEEYQKVLVDWTAQEVENRYPRVTGIQHVQNPIVTVEGENLLPPFHEWTLHMNATAVNPYELELNATANFQVSYVDIPVIEGYHYTVINNVGFSKIESIDDSGSRKVIVDSSALEKVFFVPTNIKRIRVTFYNATIAKLVFKNPMLTLGSEPKPFVPRNPSHLYAECKLGRIGNKKDTLFQENGEWKVREEIVKDVVLDGRLTWNNGVANSELRLFYVSQTTFNEYSINAQFLIKYNGVILKRDDGLHNALKADHFRSGGGTTSFWIGVSNQDAGFPNVYTPTTSDIKRYFNGWKYTDGTTWTSVTGNGQTATAQQALDTKPTDYTPYKLSYVRATPQVKSVNVEGALNVQGKAQVNVDSGAAIRERVVPRTNASTAFYWINNVVLNSQLKEKVIKILSVYKDGTDVTGSWSIAPHNNAFGRQMASFPKDSFDTNAIYTVTYLVLDRHNFTINPTKTQATVEQSLLSSFSQISAKNADVETQVTINTKLLAELYKQTRSLGGF